jgi:hypothetical protein
MLNEKCRRRANDGCKPPASLRREDVAPCGFYGGRAGGIAIRNAGTHGPAFALTSDAGKDVPTGRRIAISNGCCPRNSARNGPISQPAKRWLRLGQLETVGRNPTPLFARFTTWGWLNAYARSHPTAFAEW